MDVEKFMERLGCAGVTVILKIDDERVRESGDPWTLVMSGNGLGGRSFIRAEAASLSDCLGQGIAQLRKCPGNWEWLTELSK